MRLQKIIDLIVDHVDSRHSYPYSVTEAETDKPAKHLNPLTRYSVYTEECYKYWTGQTIPRQSPYERCDNGRLS